MAGLLDGLNPDILSLLSGGGSADKKSPSPGGLLQLVASGNQGASNFGAGLLGGGWRGPSPDEDFSTRLFGNPRDPSDPRGQAMMALSIGLMRGKFADGLEGYNKAFTDAEDRAGKRQISQLLAGKTALELQQMLDTSMRNKSIRDGLSKLDQEGGSSSTATDGASGQQPTSADQFGTASIGGIPMFSLTNGPGNYTEPRTASTGTPFSTGATAQSAPSRAAFAVPPAYDANGTGAGALSPSAIGQSQSSRSNYTQELSNRLLRQAQVYASNGDFDTANKVYESARKWLPEVHKMEVLMAGDKPVNVITYKDGRQQVSPFGAKPDVHWLDTGSQIQGIDQNTMRPLGTPYAKGMTPGEVASNRVAQGNLRVAQDRLDLDRNSPQYMQTDGGLVALPKRPAPGAPLVGQPVTGPAGEQLGPQLKQIPPAVNTAIVTNMQNLGKARAALDLIRGGSVGSAEGDTSATGWKGYLPDAVLNRADTKGIDTRAAIADLGSMVIHERSGAAVTAAESPRLKPFIPLITDSPEMAEKKLKRFVEIYQQETDALGDIYSKEQGYRPNPVLTRSAKEPRESAAPLVLPRNPTASSLTPGGSYKLPNGKVGVWDGMQFRVQK